MANSYKYGYALSRYFYNQPFNNWVPTAFWKRANFAEFTLYPFLSSCINSADVIIHGAHFALSTTTELRGGPPLMSSLSRLIAALSLVSLVLAAQNSRMIGWGIRFKLQMLCPLEDE